MSKAPSTTLDWAGWVAHTPRGGVRTVITPSPVEEVARLSRALESGTDLDCTTVVWDGALSLEAALESGAVSLARIAQARWPEWDATGPEGNSVWRDRADALCARGRLPLPLGYGMETHTTELTRLLGPSRLIVVCAMTEAAPSDERLHSFARAAEWLAVRSGARVLAIVHARLASHHSLAPILYNAEFCDGPNEEKRVASDEPPRVAIPPLIGSPHPDSAGECLLAAALSADPELSGLFACNQWVHTGAHEKFLADFVWGAGKLVVEVDGYRWHSAETVFRADRYRDYRLLNAGYLVLRLPHDEVLSDVALQCEKIRDIVHVIQQRESRR